MLLENVINILFSALVVYIVLIIYVRIAGLRSFSQMTAVDFAVTVAIGTILSSTILPNTPSIIEGSIALGFLFFIQWFVSACRRKSKKFRKYIENSPLLIMKNGKIIEENLRAANLTKADLIAKLRESNAYKFSSVKAVVFESTGDVSVLHGDDSVDEEIFYDVRETP